VNAIIRIMLKYTIFLYLCVAAYAAFMPQEEDMAEKAVDIQGSVDDEVDKGKFLILQIKRTTTTTSTSVTTLSTFTICLKAYSTADNCAASGRKKRSASVEDPPVIHKQVERAINEKPYNEQTMTMAVAAADMGSMSGLTPDDKGRFYLPSVSSTTTTVSTTSTSTSYTAIVTVTASSCNAALVLPVDFCLSG